jgi:hypothetical protein
MFSRNCLSSLLVTFLGSPALPDLISLHCHSMIKRGHVQHIGEGIDRTRPLLQKLCLPRSTMSPYSGADTRVLLSSSPGWRVPSKSHGLLQGVLASLGASTLRWIIIVTRHVESPQGCQRRAGVGGGAVYHLGPGPSNLEGTVNTADTTTLYIHPQL